MSRGFAPASSSNGDAAHVVVLGTFGRLAGAVETVADGPATMRPAGRRISSPDLLPIGGRCLTVIVTGSNNVGSSDGEEVDWPVWN
jgi:hypothetical protein